MLRVIRSNSKWQRKEKNQTDLAFDMVEWATMLQDILRVYRKIVLSRSDLVLQFGKYIHCSVHATQCAVIDAHAVVGRAGQMQLR